MRLIVQKILVIAAEKDNPIVFAAKDIALKDCIPKLIVLEDTKGKREHKSILKYLDDDFKALLGMK